MKKGKIVRPVHVSMKVYLTLLVLVQVGIMSLATGLVGALLQYLGVSFAAWQALVVLGISALLGSLLTGLVNRLFFAPISRLGQAMGQVAKGNFHVRLEEPQRFREPCGAQLQLDGPGAAQHRIPAQGLCEQRLPRVQNPHQRH